MKLRLFQVLAWTSHSWWSTLDLYWIYVLLKLIMGLGCFPIRAPSPTPPLSLVSSTPPQSPLFSSLLPANSHSPSDSLHNSISFITLLERVGVEINAIKQCQPSWPLFQVSTEPWPAVLLLSFALDTFHATCPIQGKFLASSMSLDLRDRSRAFQPQSEQSRLIYWASFSLFPWPTCFLSQ